MDTGLAVRPTSGATQTSIARPDPAPVRQAVATDLAAAQSVTASTNTDAARHDAQSAQDSNVRKIILDAHSREVIFQVVNAESGRVVRQVPKRPSCACAPIRARSRKGRPRTKPPRPISRPELSASLVAFSAANRCPSDSRDRLSPENAPEPHVEVGAAIQPRPARSRPSRRLTQREARGPEARVLPGFISSLTPLFYSPYIRVCDATAVDP